MKIAEKTSRWIHRLLLPLVAGVGCAVAANTLVDRSPTLNRIETLAAPDQRPKGGIAVDKRLRVITIEEGTMDDFPLSPQGRLKRGVYADLLGKLRKAGAKTVLFDLIFDARTDDDARFVEALRNLGPMNVTLMTGIDEKAGKHPLEVTPKGFVGTFLKIPIYDPSTMPHVRLGSAAGLGPPDEAIPDGGRAFVGALPYQYQKSGPPLIYGAFQAALQQGGFDERDAKHEPSKGLFTCGTYQFRLEGNQQVMAQFPSRIEEIPRVELSKAMSDLDGPRASGYKDALVVVGVVGTDDTADTVPLGRISGVDFVAVMVNTALTPASERLTDAPPSLYLALAAAAAAVAFALGFSRRAFYAVLGLGGLAGLAWCLPDTVASGYNVVLPRVIPVLATVLGAALGLFASVTPLFRTEHRAAGATEEATILFLDVRGSTRLLDDVGVDRYRMIVADLLAAVTKIAVAAGGTVERTLGDGCLVVFRPNRPRHHALRAVDAVGPMLAATAAVAGRHGRPLGVGIGFETGMVSGGYVTEGRNRVWSSAGRTVNLAQRLQSASEGLGAEVVVGPVAAHLIEDHRAVRSLARIDVKGFEGQVEAFTLAA